MSRHREIKVACIVIGLATILSIYQKTSANAKLEIAVEKLRQTAGQFGVIKGYQCHAQELPIEYCIEQVRMNLADNIPGD